DLAAAHRAVAAGTAVALPAPATSLRRWALLLAAHAHDAKVTAELAYWRQMQSLPALLMTEGRLDAARDTLGSAGRLSVTLAAGMTETLLRRAPAVFHGGVNDVLLSALALAVADWCRRRD